MRLSDLPCVRCVRVWDKHLRARVRSHCATCPRAAFRTRSRVVRDGCRCYSGCRFRRAPSGQRTGPPWAVAMRRRSRGIAEVILLLLLLYYIL